MFYSCVEEVVLTTYLTITGFGAHGGIGDESFKEHPFWNKRCQKGAENVRKKFRQLFGTVKPKVRDIFHKFCKLPKTQVKWLILVFKSFIIRAPHMH